MDEILLRILQNREERSLIQKRLCKSYNLPVISFTLNIAGDIKRNKLYDIIFKLGCKQIESNMLFSKLENKQILFNDYGNTAFYVYHCSADLLKRTMIKIEDQNDLSRLYDIDVIDDKSLTPLKRTNFGFPPRSCLICKDVDYNYCRGRKNHSFDEIVNKTKNISQDNYVRILSNIARFSLECELSTSPKPGLVDRFNNGSHLGMNYNLLLVSIDCIIPFLEMEYRACFDYKNKNDLFKKMKKIGILAEKKMLEITKGVNTHKGAFFSLATIGCAISYCIAKEENISIHNIQQFVKEFGDWSKFNNMINLSNGNHVRINIGDYGIYSELLSGYSSVFLRCNKYLNLFKENTEIINSLTKLINTYSFDKDLFTYKIEPICLRIMCTLLSCVNDSNIIYRGGLTSLYEMHDRFTYIDSMNYSDVLLKEILINEDKKFTTMNLSPGGVANLLTLELFIMIIISLEILELN